jgi:hypothetical protein
MKLDIKLEIEPHQGIADIHFGMTAAQIQRILADTPTTFRRTPDSEPMVYDRPEVIDDYPNLGIQISYDAAGHCEAIELAAPANPTFKGKPLVGKPFHEIRDWLQSIDHNLEIDEAGLTAHTVGFGLYAPFASSDPTAPIEAVIVFPPNYYA